jgi:hypothetical protein
MGEHDCATECARPFSFSQVGLRPLVAIAPSLPVIAFGESRFARGEASREMAENRAR